MVNADDECAFFTIICIGRQTNDVDVQIAPDCERNLAAAACFVTTPDNANIVEDLAKLKACNAETCWASCLAMDTCVGTDFRQGTGDCWLKSVLDTPTSVLGIEH
jgi:hypothetical protein